MRMLNPVSVVPASAVFGDIDDLMDSFFPSLATTAERKAFDVIESEDHFVVSMDMPGIKKEDLKVEAKDRDLTIWGERRRANGASETFNRTLTLPPTVAEDKIEVHLEDGVLNLLLPKHQAAKPRTLEVQSGSGFFSKLLKNAGAETQTKQ